MNPERRKNPGMAEIPASAKLRAKAEPPKNRGAKWKNKTCAARKKRRPVNAGSELRRGLSLAGISVLTLDSHTDRANRPPCASVETALRPRMGVPQRVATRKYDVTPR